MSGDPFGARGTLKAAGGEFTIFRLPKLAADNIGPISAETLETRIIPAIRAAAGGPV